MLVSHDIKLHSEPEFYQLAGDSWLFHKSSAELSARPYHSVDPESDANPVAHTIHILIHVQRITNILSSLRVSLR